MKKCAPSSPDSLKALSPLGFPVIMEDRDLLWKRLKSCGVHADIHWMLPPEVCDKEYPPKARGSQGAFLRSHATSGIQKKRWPGWLRQ